MTEQFVKDN